MDLHKRSVPLLDHSIISILKSYFPELMSVILKDPLFLTYGGGSYFLNFSSIGFCQNKYPQYWFCQNDLENTNWLTVYTKTRLIKLIHHFTILLYLNENIMQDPVIKTC